MIKRAVFLPGAFYFFGQVRISDFVRVEINYLKTHPVLDLNYSKVVKVRLPLFVLT